MHSIAAGSAPTIHSGPGYADASPFPASRATCGASYVRELKRWMYNLIHNFQMNLSVGSVEELRRTPAERTLRIKNNKAGCCIFEVFVSPSLYVEYFGDNLLIRKRIALPPTLVT